MIPYWIKCVGIMPGMSTCEVMLSVMQLPSLSKRSFLTQWQRRGSTADDAESEADDSADDTELPPLKLPGNKFLKLPHSKEDEDSIPGKCIASMKTYKEEEYPFTGIRT